MNYEEILQTVRGFCAREKLLDGKKHLALAVSGGADSMALLCLIRPLAEESPGRGRTGRAACGMPALSGCWPTG